MTSATPEVLMMLLAPGAADSSLSNERTVFWLRSQRHAQRTSGRAWREPGITPSLLALNPPQHHQLLGDIWPVPFPPLTGSPSAAAHLGCKLSHTSKALLCLGPNLEEFPLSVCQTPKITTAQNRGARCYTPQRTRSLAKTLTCTHTNVHI